MDNPARTFFEDLVVGEPVRVGSVTLTRDETISFAQQFDPQDFHLDDEAAAHSIFGRVAASGWHTASLSMRLMVDHMHALGLASLGGAGVDELRWLKPVYPGDTLTLEMELLEKRRSAKRPAMGLTRQRNTMINQHGEPVMSYVATGLVGVRNPEAPIDEAE